MDKSTGQVSCTFEDSTATIDSPVCPFVDGAVQTVAEFFNDNFAWLVEFRNVLDRMLTNGYIRPACTESLCKLQL
jgi:hypothetical protein